MIAPGDVLKNRYRIERSIGRGGMGEVFAAVVLVPMPGKESDEDATLLLPSEESYRVAIKVVSRAVVSEAAMARLEREAVAASRIESEYVPELIEVSSTAEGEVFLAMELLYGDTLSERLKEQRALAWEEVLALGDDVLSGLADAHAAGVIHRDLKPSNIFLCEPVAPGVPGRAKVLDFGVCKLDAPDEHRLTGTGESVGTASYMAPEQIRGASGVTERADLYSFGTVVFEALSGQLPHLGTGQMAMLASKLERSALRLSDVAVVSVPEGLDALLARLLSRDASKRSATARDVQREWRALGPAVVPPRASSPLASPTNAPLPTETGLASGTIGVASPRISRLGIALAAFAVAVSSVVIAMLVGAARPTRAASPDFTSEGTSDERPTAAALSATPAVPRVALPRQPSVEPASAVDSGSWPSEDDGPPVLQPSKPLGPRPPPPWVRPAGRPATTKPHIADKPRY